MSWKIRPFFFRGDVRSKVNLERHTHAGYEKVLCGGNPPIQVLPPPPGLCMPVKHYFVSSAKQMSAKKNP